jgi:hypothetical protein
VLGPGLRPAPAVALVLLLCQSAEAKAFWQVAEGAAAELLMVVVLAAPAEPCAVLGRPRPAVGAPDSVTPAVWEPERYRVSAPKVPLLAEVLKSAAAKEG